MTPKYCANGPVFGRETHHGVCKKGSLQEHDFSNFCILDQSSASAYICNLLFLPFLACVFILLFSVFIIKSVFNFRDRPSLGYHGVDNASPLTECGTRGTLTCTDYLNAKRNYSNSDIENPKTFCPDRHPQFTRS